MIGLFLIMQPSPSSVVLIATTATLIGGTVGYHCDCIRSCYSCVILAELQVETEGYANC